MEPNTQKYKIEIEINEEELRNEIVNGVMKSSFGQIVAAAIKTAVAAKRREYLNMVDLEFKHAVMAEAKKLVREEYVPQIKDLIRAAMTEELIKKATSQAIDALLPPNNE